MIRTRGPARYQGALDRRLDAKRAGLPRHGDPAGAIYSRTVAPTRSVRPGIGASKTSL